MLEKIIFLEKEVYPIFQAGMGVGVSLAPLAGAVAKEGCIGTISSAFLDVLVSARLRRRVDSFEAAYEEVMLAKEISGGNGMVAINVMVALGQHYEASILGAVKAGVGIVISGAGLPIPLPKLIKGSGVKWGPIASSARTLEVIIKRSGEIPDLVVVEGPPAGGHLGFKFEELEKEKNRLENLFLEVKAVAEKYGIPVVVAGRIYSHEDIVEWQNKRADAVQMGTRFMVTNESSASQRYKEAVVRCTKSDIVVADPVFNPPGSPCGMPFRVIKFSPMFLNSGSRSPLCNKGYVLQKDGAGNFTKCPAKNDSQNFFCICNGLLSSAGYSLDRKEDRLDLYTVGENAWRVDRILSVQELVSELLGN